MTLPLGVAAHVGQGLAGELDHVGGPAAELGGGRRVDLGDGQDPGALPELLHQTMERLVEVAVGQDAGAQPEDVVAQVADDPVQLLHRVLEAGRRSVAAGQQGRSLQAHPDREQGLDGPVMELLGDPLAVLEHGQALQLLLQPGILEGDGCLLGEGLDQLHGRLPQGRAALGVGHRQRAQGAATRREGTNRAGPTPARTIGWAARSSADASWSATASPVRSTSPVTDPDAGKVAPCSSLGEQPVGGLDPQARPPRREGQAGQVGADQRPGVAHHQGEQLAGIDAGQDRRGDRPDRLQPPRPVLGLLIQVASGSPPRPGWPAGPGPARRRRRSPRRRASRQ